MDGAGGGGGRARKKGGWEEGYIYMELKKGRHCSRRRWRVIAGR